MKKAAIIDEGVEQRRRWKPITTNIQGCIHHQERLSHSRSSHRPHLRLLNCARNSSANHLTNHHVWSAKTALFWSTIPRMHRRHLHIWKQIEWTAELASSLKHCDRGVITLKCHLLDHLLDDLERFGTVLVLSASPYAHFNLTVKQSYASTCKSLHMRTKDTANVLGTNLKGQKVSTSSLPQVQSYPSARRQVLVHSGEHINLQCSSSFQTIRRISLSMYIHFSIPFQWLHFWCVLTTRQVTERGAH